MRHLIPTIFLLLFISCSRDYKTTTDNQALIISDSAFASNLIAADFLIYANSLKIDSLKNQVKTSSYIYDDSNNKIAHIDAEELADFNSTSSYPV